MFHSELQEKCELLEANQAQADEKVVTLTSELEALKKVAQEKNVQEEVLQAQVLEKEKQISELQLTSDAEHRYECNKMYLYTPTHHPPTHIHTHTHTCACMHICIHVLVHGQSFFPDS